MGVVPGAQMMGLMAQAAAAGQVRLSIRADDQLRLHEPVRIHQIPSFPVPTKYIYTRVSLPRHQIISHAPRSRLVRRHRRSAWAAILALGPWVTTRCLDARRAAEAARIPRGTQPPLRAPPLTQRARQAADRRCPAACRGLSPGPRRPKSLIAH